MANRKKQVTAEEFHDRLKRLVRELEALQADARRAGLIGLTGNTNMALSYVMASERSMRNSY